MKIYILEKEENGDEEELEGSHLKARLVGNIFFY